MAAQAQAQALVSQELAVNQVVSQALHPVSSQVAHQVENQQVDQVYHRVVYHPVCRAVNQAVHSVPRLALAVDLEVAPGLTVAVYMVTLCSSGIAILQQHVRVVSVAMQSGNATTIQAV